MSRSAEEQRGYTTGLMELLARAEQEKTKGNTVNIKQLRAIVMELTAKGVGVELPSDDSAKKNSEETTKKETTKKDTEETTKKETTKKETKSKGEEKPAEKPPAKGKGRGKKETICEQPAKVEIISEKRKGKSKPAPPPEPTPAQDEEEELVITVPPFSSTSSEADE